MTTLEPFSSLGMAGVPNSGPYYVNDASIVLPVGNQIIQQSLDTGERSFLLSSRLTAGGARHTKITAFSVTSDGSCLAIASTRNNEPPILCLYTIPNGQQIMQMPQENSSEIYFVGFHRSLKVGCYIVADPRKFRINVFNLANRSEIKSVSFTERYEVAQFHPTNDNLILLYSSKSLASFKTTDNTVMQLQVPNYSRFSGFVFSLNEQNVCVATSGRDVLFFQDMQLKHTMTITEDSPIIFLATFSHGLILATESNRLILIQHVPGLKDLSRIFQQGPIVSYGIAHPIIWAAFSPSGHQMICNVDYRQLIIVNIREFESNTENNIVNPNIISHKGPVASISSCAYKPMLVSCGVEDRTVIVWDYSKQ